MAWLGSKTNAGLWQAILALMPAHDTFVDLFAGSGEILRRKPLSRFTYGVDKDDAAPVFSDPPPGAVLFNKDWLKFMDGFRPLDWSRVLIYADPPYLHSTRGRRHRYRFEFDDAQHAELLTVLRCCPALVIVSGYPSELYDHHLFGWNSRSVQVMTRGGVRTEKLWFNFPPSQAGQFWAAHAGKNFTDRQRIKRKVERWKKMFSRVSPDERLALISGLLQSDETCSIDTDDSAVRIDDRDYSSSGLSAPLRRRQITRLTGDRDAQMSLPIQLEEGKNGVRGNRANSGLEAVRSAGAAPSKTPRQGAAKKHPSGHQGLSLVRPGHGRKGKKAARSEGAEAQPIIELMPPRRGRRD